MKLSQIIDSIRVKSVSGSLDADITGVCFDSREAVPGSLFCALPGVTADGNEFVAPAVEAGAAVVISEKPYPADTSAVWLEVENAREAMGWAAANFYGNPSLEMPVAGVTGTNGKTTTSLLIHHLMQSTLHRAGMIGTIHYLIGDRADEAPRTTPESPDLQRMLREMRDEDCRGAVMEVSSHGLCQHRSTGVHFDVGIFTNLSQDHLDYHGNMENYYQAKKLLLERIDSDLKKEGSMLINRDDAHGERMLNALGISRVKRISFGLSPACDYRASDIRYDFNGTQFTLTTSQRTSLVKTPLIGGFNVYNAVAALAAAVELKLNLREAIKNLEHCPQVPGRLESVVDRQINYRVFVDYAHTPDALVNAIAALRELNPNRLITVFGCGGDRDREKRPPMAAAAEQGSDLAILTSDNPRSEDPEQILEDAQKGFQRSSSYELILDRREAIRRAIDLAGERDIVLIAGKGHETYQEIDGVKHDFDDRQEARNAIAARAEMPKKKKDQAAQ